MRLHSPSRARVVVLGPPNLPHRWFRIASRFPCQQQGPQHENVIGGSRMIGRGSPHECKLNATGCDFHTAVGDPATAYEKAWKCHRIIGPFARLIPARVATIEKTMRSQNPSCGGKRCKTYVHLRSWQLFPKCSHGTFGIPGRVYLLPLPVAFSWLPSEISRRR